MNTKQDIDGMIRIKFWSDYRCPFCYIAHVQNRKVFQDLKDAAVIVVEPKAFELYPFAPYQPDQTVAQVFANKYGKSIQEAEKRIKAIDAYGQRVGINGYNYANAKPVNTFDAHRLTKFCLMKGVSDIYEKLMKAYFVDGRNIADHTELARIASEVGINKLEVLDMLNSNAFAAMVRQDEAQAKRKGVVTVPSYVFPDGEIITGAGSNDLLRDAILSRIENHRLRAS